MQVHLQVLVLLSVFGAIYTQSSKVTVDVFYESLCPDSRRFINTQLYPSLQGSLKNSVSLNLIPYGKSTHQTRGSDVEFQCHHGPNECYGNKVHACALSHIQVDSYQHQHTKESLTLAYVNCLMENSNLNPGNVFPTESCARKTGVQQLDQIISCANGTEGSNLLANYGEKTQRLNPPLKSVPTIVFNSQYDQSLQSLAENNFMTAVCKQLSSPRPQECPQINSATGKIATAAAIVLALTATAML